MDEMQDRILKYGGEVKIELERDGVKEAFFIKPIRPKDISKILSSLGNMGSKAEQDVTGEEMSKVMDAVSEVALTCIKRTYPTIDDDKAEGLIMKNYDVFAQMIMNQVEGITKLSTGFDKSKFRTLNQPQ